MRKCIFMACVLALLCLCACAHALPVIEIETVNGELPGQEDTAGFMTVREEVDGAVQEMRVQIEINVRGNTSQRFPKKSYRVQAVTHWGDTQDISLCGLRSDDDWILNPMYTDDTKIREALAYDVWAMMNGAGKVAASSRMRYAEVYMNGEYWGLYAVQERIDRKQVDADKKTGVLYKMIANNRPTVAELLMCREPEEYRGIKLEYAGKNVTAAWHPAAAYIAHLDEMPSPTGDKLDLDNTIDYGLFVMLVQAHDCHFKNQFVHAVLEGEDYVLYRMPWDLNNTFGDVWDSDAEKANYTRHAVVKLTMDGAFELLVYSKDTQVYEKIRARWQELRAGVLADETIVLRARELYAPLTEAIARDSARWPTCGKGEGNAQDILAVEAFTRRMLQRVDEFVDGLGK